MRIDQLNDLAVFRVVAMERSFTRAAARLGVTQSALSQTLKRLEAELGVKLLVRTTRSVAPTHAGEQLLATLHPAMADIAASLDELKNQRDEPGGTIRVTTGKHAADTVLWPALAELLPRHADIHVEVSVDNNYVDIVAERFDAGIRLGEQLERDMVGIPIGPPLRMAVVGSPAYFAQHGRPQAPAELRDHRCICFMRRDGTIPAWEFEKDGRKIAIKAAGGAVFNDGDLLIKAATAGLGVSYIMEDQVIAALTHGNLQRVLEDWCVPFPGYYLFYPNRRHPVTAFTVFVAALVDKRDR
ncbi:MAG: LysR family transcriptional regulator [Pseudomonadota bacterium]|nr:LysR family transcriptional regulator [Pseudomonadota bacterium]